ncbi:MAG: M24 family metallopeptidase [Lachnospiraceae bacterium]|nr:M24 family metallopeptidase [Lachnospiraceae bacterium]
MKPQNVIYRSISAPEKDCALPILFSDQTMEERKEKVLARMNQKGLDKLMIYCDVEHGNNFSYLVGFYTRFEEALLILDKSGEMVLMLGNENLNKCAKARFSCRAVHVSMFSLPNQPTYNDKPFIELLAEAGISKDQRVGIVGWKNFTSASNAGTKLFDIPAFILDATRILVGTHDLITNETALFIGENGARVTNNANEIAHYEYGAALASDCMLDAMNALDIGVSELELGDKLVRLGQHTSVTTIAAAGERFIKGNMFPTAKKVQLGDPISMTVGYAGGLSSRAGYAVHCTEDLPESARGYLDELAIPYYHAYTTWMNQIRIGMTGGELYDIIESVLPKSEYHWSLCPGHLVAEEEWLSSPVYEGSQEVLKSGMIFQIDIIPSKAGFAGASAESTVVLADTNLKKQIQDEYPKLWERMQKRLHYIREELNIPLSDDLLPMCSTVAYLRPYLLNKDMALVLDK